jgi:ribosome-binding protein aMBF1 (putative translation factor)
MGLPLEVLAERINEKESYLRSIEHGKMSPTLLVARKLEKELGVKLVETVTEEVTTMDQKKPASYRPQTLEDILEFQKKGKKK